MRIIIRYTHSRGLGQEVHQSVFDGEAVTIGRGADQVIQIPDKRLPLAHAKLSMTSGHFSINALNDQRVAVNEQITRYAPLVVGDTITIAGYDMRVHAGEAGADFVIEVFLDHEQIESMRERFQTRLWQVGVPERQFAWLIFILIVGLGLIVPLAGFFTDIQWLRDSPLPDDRIWSTGALHSGHAFMAQDCNFCHSRPFAQTRDQECLACHQTIKHHFDTASFGLDYQVADACGDCHQEHSATGSITRSDQEVCSVCHADLNAAGFDSERLGNASDFLDHHPEFKVTLQHYGDDGQWQSSRSVLQDPALQEASNLLFPHDVHLLAEGIDSPDGVTVLNCGDCHESEKGGLRMKTVTMETHCASCHQLNFDATTPDRVVPHGSPELLMQTLREYYALQFFQRFNDGTVQPGEDNLGLAATRDARRPGKSPRGASIAEQMLARPSDGQAPLSEQAQAFIEAQVKQAAANLFEQQTCILCHEIKRVADAAVPWQVLPVHLNGDWLPLADFSHDSHKNMQCADCHQAQQSKLASDVLMPTIDSCQSCHGGEDADQLLPSSCVTCHSFHLPSQPAWRASPAAVIKK